jgi:hypothetical protein
VTIFVSNGVKKNTQANFEIRSSVPLGRSGDKTWNIFDPRPHSVGIVNGKQWICEKKRSWTILIYSIFCLERPKIISCYRFEHRTWRIQIRILNFSTSTSVGNHICVMLRAWPRSKWIGPTLKWLKLRVSFVIFQYVRNNSPRRRRSVPRCLSPSESVMVAFGKVYCIVDRGLDGSTEILGRSTRKKPPLRLTEKTAINTAWHNTFHALWRNFCAFQPKIEVTSGKTLHIAI